jgi:hypothetical protein
VPAAQPTSRLLAQEFHHLHLRLLAAARRSCASKLVGFLIRWRHLKFHIAAILKAYLCDASETAHWRPSLPLSFCLTRSRHQVAIDDNTFRSATSTGL